MSSVKKNIKKSKTIPSNFYYCKTKFQKIKESLFTKYWQYICDTSQLKKHGDVMPYDFIEGFIEDPLILVNNHNNIQSISNVCTHRGNILVEKAGNIQNGIICRYHGRKFDTCGNFNFMPKCEEVENFPSKNDNLAHTPCEIWKQFIFTSINPKISLHELTKDMEKRVG